MLMDDNFKIALDESKNKEYENTAKVIQQKIKSLQEENNKLNKLKQLYLKKFFG
jgi:hypothetical protein